jgi:hypothetical protein
VPPRQSELPDNLLRHNCREGRGQTMRTWFLRVFVLICAPACLALPLAGQSDQWHTYKNAAGNFSVLMPAEPQETTGSEPSQTSHTIQAISNSIGYTVVYVIIPGEQVVDEPTYRVYRDAFMKSLPNCELVTETDPSNVVRGYVGHWYRMNCLVKGSKFTFVGNLYWGKHYAYAVLAMFPTAPSTPPTATKFTDSFAVIDPAK